MGNDVQTRLRPVTSRQNQTVKTLREAFSHSGMSADGLYAIEGERMVEDAIQAGWKLRVVAFSESARNIAERLLSKIKKDVECILLPDDVFQSAVATEAPQGVAGLMERKMQILDDVCNRKTKLCVVAVEIQDPGNLGTIIRSAEAFHADGVLLTENTVSVWNPKTVRATAGSVLRIPCAQAKSADIQKKLQAMNIRSLGTSSHAKQSITEYDLRGPLALFIGNEGAGIPKDILNSLDEVATIPFATGVESLNAGVAASVALYEIARQRAVHLPARSSSKNQHKTK